MAGNSIWTADPKGTLLFAWLPPHRVLMVWVYDRTESLLRAGADARAHQRDDELLASEATSGTALLIRVLIWGAAFGSLSR
jgi:hypothetical protein